MIKYNKVKRGGVMKTHVLVVEGYRPGKGLPTRQRTIKSFGYLEDQEDKDSFIAKVKEFNENYKAEKVPLRIEAYDTDKMYSEKSRKQNYGYKFLESVYDSLKIDEFINKYLKLHKFKGDYSPAKIFKLLTFLRMLSPDSMRASFQMKEDFYGMDTHFNLQDIYRALDKFSDFQVGLQKHLNKRIKKIIDRDLSRVFYDVTNYFFQIDFPDGDDDLRKNGVSKEHRLDPIVAMGLFIDNNGIPISMSLFQGNKSDAETLKPALQNVKEEYGIKKTIIVADKGLNSLDNFNEITSNGDKYVISQILKGTKGKRYHKELFDIEGYTTMEGGDYKYKLFEEEYIGIKKNGKSGKIKRNVLIYWTKKNADRARRKREEKLLKALKATKNNAYNLRTGVEYTREDIIDKETGEFLTDIKKQRTIDIEKAKRDAMFDGYFCIITNELSFDEKKIREVYGSLWKIEQSFRIMKSDLIARPVFVRKNEHIAAHFLICFVSLLVIRIIQYRMGEKPLSAERIARALRTANCHVFKGGIIHLDDVGGALAFNKRLNKKGRYVDTLKYSNEDEIALDYKVIQKLFGTNCDNSFLRQETFNKFLKSISVS
jgi:transposase